jgi:hypothetical protein
MGLEPLGIIVIMFGLVTLFLRPHWAFQLMALSTLFGAGMAINLPALGGAGVLVPNLFLVFFMARIWLAAGTAPAVAFAIPPRPGFWLLALTALGVLSAFFLPRLFAGVTDTMAVTRTYGGKSFITPAPLGPTGTNITQAVYAVGGLLAFSFAFAHARYLARPAQIIRAFLIVGLACAAAAALDLVTFYTGTGFILDSVRTANYNFLTATEMSGMKRIAGTFAEASAFASYMLPLFAFSASLWLDRARSMLAAPAAALLLVALVLSTSATGLAGLAAVIAMLTGRSVLSAMQRPGMMRTASIGVAVMACAAVLLALPVVAPTAAMEWWDYLQEALFNKATSSSGQERMLWNTTALQNFIDTNWVGAGLGSARASSYPLVLLSNVGIAGFVLFLAFVISLLGARTGWASAKHQDDLEAAQAIRAGKAGFAGVLISSALSATVYDLGLTVYLMAGTAAGLSVALKARPGAALNVSLAPITWPMHAET